MKTTTQIGIKTAFCIGILMLLSNALAIGQNKQNIKSRYGTGSQQVVDQYLKGIEEFRANDFEEAERLFAAGLKIDPEFQLGMYWLGQTYEALKEHDKEITVYEKLYATRDKQWSKTLVEGCLNAGLSAGKRGKLELSEFWFSRSPRIGSRQPVWIVCKDLSQPGDHKIQ